MHSPLILPCFIRCSTMAYSLRWLATSACTSSYRLFYQPSASLLLQTFTLLAFSMYIYIYVITHSHMCGQNSRISRNSTVSTAQRLQSQLLLKRYIIEIYRWVQSILSNAILVHDDLESQMSFHFWPVFLILEGRVAQKKATVFLDNLDRQFTHHNF